MWPPRGTQLKNASSPVSVLARGDSDGFKGWEQKIKTKGGEITVTVPLVDFLILIWWNMGSPRLFLVQLDGGNWWVQAACKIWNQSARCDDGMTLAVSDKSVQLLLLAVSVFRWVKIRTGNMRSGREAELFPSRLFAVCCTKSGDKSEA